MDGLIATGYPAFTGLDQLSDLFAREAPVHDHHGSVPVQALFTAHKAGLLTLAIPATQGGHGADLALSAEIVGTLAQADPAATLIVAMHTLAHAAIAQSGRWPERVRAGVVRAAIEQGALIGALRLEPEPVIPAPGALPVTIARRGPEGWRLFGRKILATGCTVLRWGVVWARTDEPEPRVGHFLVPLDVPGVSIEPNRNQLGLRASGSHTVLLHDVLVPLDHAVDLRAPERFASTDPLQALWNDVLIAALFDGVARGARRWLGDFLRARPPGDPLTASPLVQQQIGRIDALLLGSRLMLSGAAAGGVSGAETGLVRLSVCENAVRAVEMAIACIGHHGLACDTPLERHLRDVLCGRAYASSPDAVLLSAGRNALAAAG